LKNVIEDVIASECEAIYSFGLTNNEICRLLRRAKAYAAFGRILAMTSKIRTVPLLQTELNSFFDCSVQST